MRLEVRREGVCTFVGIALVASFVVMIVVHRVVGDQACQQRQLEAASAKGHER
ncbi:hypothetical protein Micbo1qcDRAFT_159012 [Microdochium bolleyi]|uniref:Uncharacterized protein n=1 Tax=Microdochium bolleyi TaxID=196109 RepID=A0A136JA38_9PEZI|nr:hypothetical protein Micbo1qcDRAFT_159012 [Microdochium bolleyi]